MTQTLTGVVTNHLPTPLKELATHVPGGAIQEFGPVTAVSVGVDLPVYNRAFVCEPPTHSELHAAVEWLLDRDVPAAVTVTEPVLEDIEPLLRDIGLERPDGISQNLPGMARSTLADLPRNDTDAAIRRVTSTEERREFVSVMGDVFDLPRALVRTVTPDSLLAAERCVLFVGRIDGDPVACGRVVTRGDVAGVYAIGVRERFRRRGLGEAMTARVLRAGRDAGCSMGVLESSEIAVPLYEQLGFETVVRCHHFQPDS